MIRPFTAILVLLFTSALGAQTAGGKQPKGSAISRVKSALEREPKNPDLLSELSILLEGEGDLDGALKAASKAHKARDDYNARIRIAWLSMGIGDFQRAAKFYTAATELVPDSEDAWLGLQWAELADENLEAAKQAGDKVLTLNSESAFGLRRQAYIAYLLNDDEAAEKLYRRALALDPDDPEMKLGLGFTLIRKERSTKAAPCAGRQPKPSRAIRASRSVCLSIRPPRHCPPRVGRTSTRSPRSTARI